MNVLKRIWRKFRGVRFQSLGEWLDERENVIVLEQYKDKGFTGYREVEGKSK